MKIVKKYLKHIILFSVLVLCFLISLFSFLTKTKGTLRSFIYPSVDSGLYIVEYRRISNDLNQSEITTYIADLLLGALTERTKMLFTPGTKIESCFVRNNVLYLSLSDDLINIGRDVVDIEEGVRLLKKNICINFRNIKKIELFVGNKYAFEEI